MTCDSLVQQMETHIYRLEEEMMKRWMENDKLYERVNALEKKSEFLEERVNELELQAFKEKCKLPSENIDPGSYFCSYCKSRKHRVDDCEKLVLAINV
jgi:hypothetical protein